MAKWRIPRHQPRNSPDWERADKNHGKRFTSKAAVNRERREKRQRIEVGFLDLVTRQTDEERARSATMRIGQCARKTRLTEAAARAKVRSAALEQGCPMYAYLCRWCGTYHLTSHPEPGVEYDIKCDGVHFRGGAV